MSDTMSDHSPAFHRTRRRKLFRNELNKDEEEKAQAKKRRRQLKRRPQLKKKGAEEEKAQAEQAVEPEGRKEIGKDGEETQSEEQEQVMALSGDGGEAPLKARLRRQVMGTTAILE